MNDSNNNRDLIAAGMITRGRPKGIVPARTMAPGEGRWLLAGIMVVAGMIAAFAGVWQMVAPTARVMVTMPGLFGAVLLLVGAMVACTGLLTWLVGPK